MPGHVLMRQDGCAEGWVAATEMDKLRVVKVATCWQRICAGASVIGSAKKAKHLAKGQAPDLEPTELMRTLLIVSYLTVDPNGGNRENRPTKERIRRIVRIPGFLDQPLEAKKIDDEVDRIIEDAGAINNQSTRVPTEWMQRALVACVNADDRRGGWISARRFFGEPVKGPGAIDALYRLMIGQGGEANPKPEWVQPLVAERVDLIETPERFAQLDRVEGEIRSGKAGGVLYIRRQGYAHGLTAFGSSLVDRVMDIDGFDDPLLVPIQRHRAHDARGEPTDRTINTVEILTVLRRYLSHGVKGVAEKMSNPVGDGDDFGKVLKELQLLLARSARPKTIIFDGVHIPPDEIEGDEIDGDDVADGRRLRRAIADDILGTIVEGLTRPPLEGIWRNGSTPDTARADDGDAAATSDGKAGAAGDSGSGDAPGTPNAGANGDSGKGGVRPGFAPLDLAAFARHRVVVLATSLPHWHRQCAVVQARRPFAVALPAPRRPVNIHLADWDRDDPDAVRRIIDAQRLEQPRRFRRMVVQFPQIMRIASDSLLAVLEALCALHDGKVSLASIDAIVADKEPLNQAVRQLLDQMNKNGLIAELQLLLLLSMVPDGVRRDTLRRFVLRAAGMPRAWQRPLPKLREFFLDADDHLVSSARLDAAILRLGAIVTDTRNDSFAPFDTEPHPLELGPDRYDGWLRDPGRSIDIALPDVKYVIRDQAPQLFADFDELPKIGGAAQTWHIAQRLLAEDALQQTTAGLRNHGAPAKRTIRAWRRFFSMFYHGLLSLPIDLSNGRLLSLPIECPDLFAPSDSAAYWQWMRSFAFGRILEDGTSYRLSRQFGQDRLKEEMAALFLRPWRLRPDPLLVDLGPRDIGRLKIAKVRPAAGRERQVPDASDILVPVEDSKYRRGTAEWLAGRIRRADITFRKADRKLFADKGNGDVRIYLDSRLHILKRRIDIALMHCAYVRLLPPDRPAGGSFAEQAADSPEPPASHEESARTAIRNAEAIRQTLGDVVERAHRPVDTLDLDDPDLGGGEEDDDPIVTGSSEEPEEEEDRAEASSDVKARPESGRPETGRPETRRPGGSRTAQADADRPLEPAAREIASLGVRETLEATLGADLLEWLLGRLEYVANGPPAPPEDVARAVASGVASNWPRNWLWSIVDVGYLDITEDPISSPIQQIVKRIVASVETDTVAALVDIFFRLGEHEMSCGWLAGAGSMLLDPSIRSMPLEFDRLGLGAGQQAHLRRAFVWGRCAEELRLNLFSENSDSDIFLPSGKPLREFVRCGLLLEREARREVKAIRLAAAEAGANKKDQEKLKQQEEEFILARRGYFGRKARHHADTHARYHASFDKERAAMLILEATMVRMLSGARADLDYALRYLGHADEILLGMARDSRLRNELSLERGKINRKMARMLIDEIAVRASNLPEEKRCTDPWLAAAIAEATHRFAASVADIDFIRQDRLAAQPFWRLIVGLQQLRAEEIARECRGLLEPLGLVAPAGAA